MSGSECCACEALLGLELCCIYLVCLQIIFYVGRLAVNYYKKIIIKIFFLCDLCVSAVNNLFINTTDVFTYTTAAHQGYVLDIP